MQLDFRILQLFRGSSSTTASAIAWTDIFVTCHTHTNIRTHSLTLTAIHYKCGCGCMCLLLYRSINVILHTIVESDLFELMKYLVKWTHSLCAHKKIYGQPTKMKMKWWVVVVVVVDYPEEHEFCPDWLKNFFSSAPILDSGACWVDVLKLFVVCARHKCARHKNHIV